MPVITSACGTGSAAKPAAAPLRATMPNSRKTPLPSRLKPRSLRSGCGMDEQAVEAKADQRGAGQAGEGRRAHDDGQSRAGPAAQGRAVRSDTAMESIMKTSIEHDQRLGEAGGIGEEGAGHGKARQADGQEHRRPGDQGEPQPASRRSPALRPGAP